MHSGTGPRLWVSLVDSAFYLLSMRLMPFHTVWESA